MLIYRFSSEILIKNLNYEQISKIFKLLNPNSEFLPNNFNKPLQMNKLSLSFTEKALETKYISQLFHEKLEKLLAFILALDFLVVFFQVYILIISSPFAKNLNYILISIAFSFIFLIFLLKKLSTPQILFSFLLMNLYSQMILYIELTNLYLSQRNSENSLILMIPFQMLHSMLIFIQMRWFFCSFSYFCSLVLLYFRVISLNSEQRPDFSVALMNFLASWVLFSFIAYINEKNHRSSFIKIEESYKKINYFHLILKNVIPSPVFLADFRESKLHFLNNSAISLLNLTNPCKNPDYFPDLQKFLASLSILPQNLQKIKDSLRKSCYFADPFPRNMQEELQRFFCDASRKPISAASSTLLRSEELNFNYNFREDDAYFSQQALSTTSKKYYELKAVKVFWEQSVSVLLLISENTEVFQVSELANVENCKSQLLASISHDLRTPLNGVHGMIEMALSQKELGKAREFLHLARKSAIFLHFLIRNILDYSLFLSKKAKLDLQSVDLQEVLKEIQELIGFQAQSKGLVFKTAILCDLHAVSLTSDRTRISQILINLLSNALKFTQKGEISLILQEVCLENSRNLLRFSVRDTGEGIAKEHMSKITSLFGKSKKKLSSFDGFGCSPLLRSKINREETGIGLGLTVSKKISRLLCPSMRNKSFEIQSVLGEGSTFSFYLESLQQKNEIFIGEHKNSNDLMNINVNMNMNMNMMSESIFQNFQKFNHSPYCSKKEIEIEENYEKNVPRASGKHIFLSRTAENSLIKKTLKKVLVVDDDCMSLFVVEQYLKLFQMESHKACNGLEAYRIVQQIVEKKDVLFDLIVMDCNMPVLNGFKASRKIKKVLLKHNLRPIPIIGMSANSTIPGKTAFRESGMEFFLEKPIRKDDFKEMVAKIFNSHSYI